MTHATANTKEIPFPLPGETLKEDFMKELKLSAYQVAKLIGVTPSAIGEIIAGKRSITPEMALRLEILTGASALFWLNLQNSYDLDKAKHDKKLSRKLETARIHVAERALA